MRASSVNNVGGPDGMGGPDGVGRMGGLLGMIAPPVNTAALVICAGIDVPYVGFTGPLLLLTFPLAILFVLLLGLPKVKNLDYEKLKPALVKQEATRKEYGVKIYIPFFVLVVLMIFFKVIAQKIGVDDLGGCHKKCRGEQETNQQAGETMMVDPASTDPASMDPVSMDPVPVDSAPTDPALMDTESTDSTPADPTEKRYHTPHSTRHTFSRLCESYDVKEADRKRMMGHSLKGDVTNGVYGHRSVAELKREVEKIEGKDCEEGAAGLQYDK